MVKPRVCASLCLPEEAWPAAVRKSEHLMLLDQNFPCAVTEIFNTCAEAEMQRLVSGPAFLLSFVPKQRFVTKALGIGLVKEISSGRLQFILCQV